MGREDNVKVFQDTQKMCKSNQRLSESIKFSTAKQQLIFENEEMTDLDLKKYKKKANIIVSKKRSFEAAGNYRGQKVCVHNFASATTPGGGVVKGSSAQEECLCRCSTLYFCLNSPDMWAGFYTPNRYGATNALHKDDCIYTPEVTVFKSDSASPQTLPEKEWYNVNIITCAAPNLREKPSNSMNVGDGDEQIQITDKELLALHEKRLTRILDVAVKNGNEIVVLGAFGCGAFRNNPVIVARAAKNVIEKYLYAFETIEFAVYCSPKDDSNYKAFVNLK